MRKAMGEILKDYVWVTLMVESICYVDSSTNGINHTHSLEISGKQDSIAQPVEESAVICDGEIYLYNKCLQLSQSRHL